MCDHVHTYYRRPVHTYGRTESTDYERARSIFYLSQIAPFQSSWNASASEDAATLFQTNPRLAHEPVGAVVSSI